MSALVCNNTLLMRSTPYQDSISSPMVRRCVQCVHSQRVALTPAFILAKKKSDRCPALGSLSHVSHRVQELLGPRCDSRHHYWKLCMCLFNI